MTAERGSPGTPYRNRKGLTSDPVSCLFSGHKGAHLDTQRGSFGYIKGLTRYPHFGLPSGITSGVRLAAASRANANPPQAPGSPWNWCPRSRPVVVTSRAGLRNHLTYGVAA